MDPSEFNIPPVNSSPRRELHLQGPRPSPLKVRKDSYKIKKPPLAPQPSQPPQQPPRQPVIIYTVSPKVIHTNPNDFMNLVQRLTGATSSSTISNPSQVKSFSPFNEDGRAISPAARYATMEKAAKTSPEGKKKMAAEEEDNLGFVEGMEMGDVIQRTSFSPGILSPGPTSLPPIPPSFFSPASDPNSFSFFHDLSPALHGNKNFMENSNFMPSPSSTNFFSPSSIDLFNNFFDL